MTDTPCHDPITFDPVNQAYLQLGANAGDAFKAGLAMKRGLKMVANAKERPFTQTRLCLDYEV